MTETLAYGTHLKILSESYPMSTNMTGFRCFSKIFSSLCFGQKKPHFDSPAHRVFCVEQKLHLLVAVGVIILLHCVGCFPARVSMVTMSPEDSEQASRVCGDNNSRPLRRSLSGQAGKQESELSIRTDVS